MSNSNDLPALSLEYDPDTETYRGHFDPTERKPSTVVVLAVATVTETDPLDVEPLNDCLDPDRFDGLFAPTHDGTPRTGGQVTFSYAGYEVTVDSAGEVILAPQQP